MERTRIEWLTRRLLAGLADSREQEELFLWLREQQDESLLSEILEKEWTGFESNADLPAEKRDQLFQAVLKASKLLQDDKEAVVRPLTYWKRWTAVAAILLILLTGGYFLLFKKTEKQNSIVSLDQQAKDVKAPETNRAMITLADGRKVYLDSVNNGQLAQEGNVKLVKLSNGQIAYETSTGQVLTEIKYNTLTNPRGSKVIDMALSDGSHVWLNAGSSVTYPVAFVGKERRLTVTGEAYFEVAPDKSRPFLVSKGDMTVKVLGTHFNVNAYEDEQDIKVTLLEGSIEVSNNQSSITIKPNQQAVVKSNTVSLNANVDVTQVMGWKNGRFQFGGAGIEEVMRQIARWYDVEVVYEVKPKEVHFGGGISRDVEMSKVFKMLETTEAVYFRIEGKKVFVIR